MKSSNLMTNTKEAMKKLKVILSKISTLFSSLSKTKKANQLLQKRKKLSLKKGEEIKTKIKASKNQKSIPKFKKNGSGPRLEKIWEKFSKAIKVQWLKGNNTSIDQVMKNLIIIKKRMKITQRMLKRISSKFHVNGSKVPSRIGNIILKLHQTNTSNILDLKIMKVACSMIVIKFQLFKFRKQTI